MPNTNPSDLDLEALEKALEAALSIRCEGTSDSPNGYGPPFKAPWFIIDTATAEPEVNWPGELIEEISDPGILHKRIRYAQIDAMTKTLSALPRASGVPEAEAVRLRREAFMARVAWQKEMGAPEAKAVAWNWRNDAFETAAVIVGIWFGAEGEKCAADIRTQIQTPPSPLASEPKDAGSGEGQLSRQEQTRALGKVLDLCTVKPGLQAYVASLINDLHAAGYRITRTAPSGAKPGEE